MSGFHDVRLPQAFSLGATGGPGWRTDVVQLASGREFRNSPWAMSRRRWDIGGAIKSLEDLETWVTMDDFEVVGYQHHDPIEYPFSV